MILLECAPDEALVRALGCPKRQCKHFAGKSRVCSWLENSTGDVGLVDEDPNTAQPPYFRHLSLSEDEHGILLYEDREREHRLIVLRPRLEEWLITGAQESKLSIGNFGLSDRGNDLHREIISRLPSVMKLLDHLLAAGSPRLRHLQSLLGL